MARYKTKNSDKASILFYQRKLYYQFMREIGANNIIDFYYGEKYMFGRVDVFYTPMILASQNSLKQIDNTADPTDSLQAINFVVDAFQDMSNEFKIASSEGKINPNDPYLSNLKVYKAYQNVNNLYENILNDFSNALIKKIKEENLQFLNFNEFTDYMITTLKSTDAIKRFPFTKPAFVKSRACPMNISGFVIEIADLSFQNDLNKIKQFVRSPNFNYYIQMCNNHGFMIDLNSPWRIVADFSVLEMRTRSSRYVGGTRSASHLLQQYFRLAGPEYYQRFKENLLSIYQSVRKDGIVLEKECNSYMVKDFVIPESYTIESLNDRYPEEFFLKLYFSIRFEEEESEYTENQKVNLERDLLSLFYARDLSTVLIIFERILNKPFDYAGSMTYIMNAANNEASTMLGGEY